MILIVLAAVAVYFFGEGYRLALTSPGGDLFSVALSDAVLLIPALYLLHRLRLLLQNLLLSVRSFIGRLFRSEPADTMQIAAEAFRAGRLRKVLRLLRNASKTDPAALRFVVRTHLMRKRPDLALDALAVAVRTAPAAAHAVLFRRIRPLVSASGLQRFREMLKTQPDVPALRRLTALDAFLDGRTDDIVMRDIAAASSPLRAELLRAAVRARRLQNQAASDALLLAALPDDEARDDEALAAAVAWLFNDETQIALRYANANLEHAAE